MVGDNHAAILVASRPGQGLGLKEPLVGSEPLPLPMRVLVKGASTVNWLSPMNGPRSDFAWPRVIEQVLLQAGQPAAVEVRAVASERATATLRSWEVQVASWSPDVVILYYGHAECIHYLLPRWLERHANSLRRRPGLARELYRRRLLRPTWMALAKLQRRVDRALPSTFFAHRPSQVTAVLERYIGRTQEFGSPLVLVMEQTPPGRRFLDWFPGIGERLEVMNGALAEMVNRIDKPNVRFFRLDTLVHQFAPFGEINPDGGHFTPQFHRAVGEALGAELLAWAATQEHLKGPVGDT